MKNNGSNLSLLVTQPKLLRNKFKLVRSGLTGLIGTSVAQTAAKSLELEKKPKVRKIQSKFLNSAKPFLKVLLDRLAVTAIVFAVITALILLIPQAYYLFTPVDTVPVVAAEDQSVLGGSFEEGTTALKQQQKAYQPPKDETLPEGEWLVIPRIGVRTQLLETENSEEALSQGVWKVPGYGEAGSTDLPVILAAHRFGWDWWWQSDYWKYNSFYLLPDTEPGDIIEIISDQRKWVYEVYGGAEGDAIADYDADLILYTCKFLNSPVRHFRYARLLDPTADSQG